MANNLEKVLDILSKAAALQQKSNIQQSQNTKESSNTEAGPSSSEPSKYINITMNDINAMFPGLADKLDINKILSVLTDKFALGKFLSGLGVVSVKPVENKDKSQDELPKDNT